MAKPKDAEGFDVEGERYRQHEDPLACLAQAAADYVSPDPCRNVRVQIQGDRVTVKCMTTGQGLDDFSRLQMHLQAVSKLVDDYVKLLKKRVREMGGGTIKMKELKEYRGFDRQKTSLNGRFEVVYRRTYEVEGLARSPEE